MTTENATPTVETNAAPVNTENPPAANAEANGTPAPSANGTAKPKGGKGKGGKGKGGKGDKGKPAAEGDSPAASAADKIAEGQKRALDEQTNKAIKAGWKNPEPVSTPLKGLTFATQLQMRNLGSEGTDEKTVERYAELMKEKVTTFAPLKAVRISAAEAKLNNLPGTVLVWDGFHTGKAAELAGVKELPVRIQDGTFRFARTLALSANSDHGKNLTEMDRRKAFYQVIDDSELMSDAVALAEANGVSGRDLTRALSFALRVSKGAVNKWLEARGLATKGGKIVKRTEQPAVPTNPTEPATPAAGQSDTPLPTTGNGSVPTPPVADLTATATTTVIGQMRQVVAGLQRRAETLLTRPTAGDIFKNLCATYQLPVSVGDPYTETRDGKEVTITPETWPALNYIAAILEETESAYNRTLNTADAPPAETPAAPPAQG